MTHGELAARVRRLAAGMRQAGVAIGVAELADALLASQLVTAELEPQRLALRATLARDPRAQSLFDQLFPWLFAAGSELPADPGAEVLPAGQGGQVPSQGGRDRGEALPEFIPAASDLAAAGTESVPQQEGDWRYHAWAASFLAWADRFGGGRAEVGRRLDLRRTLRHSLATGGDPVTLVWKRRPVRRQSLVLLDASRSMRPWAESGLQLARAMARRRADTEVYAFSAQVSRLSRRLGDGALTLPAAAWGSGTRIGEAIRAVLRGAPLAPPRRLSTLIVSDALEAGSLTPLAGALAELRRRSAVVTWANPLADSAGYQALTDAARLVVRAADRYQGLAALTQGPRRRAS